MKTLLQMAGLIMDTMPESVSQLLYGLHVRLCKDRKMTLVVP